MRLGWSSVRAAGFSYNLQPGHYVHNNHCHQASAHLQLNIIIIIIIIINPFAPELFFFISAHPVYKMWIIQEPNKLALWNRLHFEELKTESIEHV